MKTFTALALVTVLAVPALGETVRPTTLAQAQAPAAQARTEVDAQRLMGRTVHNLQNEVLGDINSVIVARDGSVSAVIVGVGGFLGIGEREVAIRWQDLRLANDGQDVRVNLTKDEIRALPEYRYAENQRRGTVIRSTAEPIRPTAEAARQAAPPPVVATTAPRSVSPTADALSANAVIGSSVRNAGNEAIGRVYDIIMDASGTPRMLVISAGGVLGIGERRAAVPLTNVRITRDGDAVFVATTLTAEQLQRLPEYQPR